MKNCLWDRKLIAGVFSFLLATFVAQGVPIISVEWNTRSNPDVWSYISGGTYQWSAQAKVYNDSSQIIEVTSVTYQLWDADVLFDDWVKTLAQSYTRVIPSGATAYLDFGPVTVLQSEWQAAANDELDPNLEFYTSIAMWNYIDLGPGTGTPDTSNAFGLLCLALSSIFVVKRVFANADKCSVD